MIDFNPEIGTEVFCSDLGKGLICGVLITVDNKGITTTAKGTISKPEIPNFNGVTQLNVVFTNRCTMYQFLYMSNLDSFCCVLNTDENSNGCKIVTLSKAN